MPKISIVLPIYNSEKFIRECMDSLLSQTFKDFEILAIYDNGTTDNTVCILEEYKKKDDRVKYINIEENRGLVQALNYGISISKGEYIARMDADDICMPERLEKQVMYLEENPNTKILATCIEAIGNIDVKMKNMIENHFNQKINDKNAEEIFLKQCAIAHPTVVFKKDVIDLLGKYRTDCKCAEDYDLWIRALRNNVNIKKVDEKLLKYRVHNNSKSSIESDDYKILTQVMNIRLNYLKYKFSNNGINYLIWGAGNGGKIAKGIINKLLPEAKLIGFIDKFKEGYLEESTIYRPEDIKTLKFDYIFIATEPGKEFAENYLINNGLDKVKDFVWLI